MLAKVRFNKFTVFENVEIPFSPGINIFLGENGTGKTHVLKALYAACDAARSDGDFAEKVNNVFYPSNKQIGRLVKRAFGTQKGSVAVFREINSEMRTLRLSLSNRTLRPEQATISGSPRAWSQHPLKAAYIPVKDMMANAPGFRSLYDEREIHFEEIYVDILRKAFLPILKGPADAQRKKLLNALQSAMDGKVINKNEEFFLRNKAGELEFTLLAEGFRKLGLLWVLIQNGTLLSGSILFWDEVETNLNPKLMRAVVNVLLELQRMGVQIFLTTHDYVILKEFDLQAEEDRDQIYFHSLYRRADTGEIDIAIADYLGGVAPNVIDDTFGDIINRELQKSVKA